MFARCSIEQLRLNRDPRQKKLRQFCPPVQPPPRVSLGVFAGSCISVGWLWASCPSAADAACAPAQSLLRTGPGFPHLERGGEHLHAAHKPNRGGAAPRSCCSPETPQFAPAPSQFTPYLVLVPRAVLQPPGAQALGSYSPQLPGGCWAPQLVPVATAA